MDPTRFDDLTRAFAGDTSRRSLLKTLGAGLAALAGIATRDTADAAKGGGGKPTGRCPTGYTNCRGTCVDLTDNTNHCGICNLQCSNGEDCCGGVCRTACVNNTVRDLATCACVCPVTAPNLCPATTSCHPTCPAGRVFNPTTCTCECVETTCCTCVISTGANAGDGYCSSTYTGSQSELCHDECSDFLGENGGGSVFQSGPGETWVCNATLDGCNKTCDDTP